MGCGAWETHSTPLLARRSVNCQQLFGVNVNWPTDPAHRHCSLLIHQVMGQEPPEDGRLVGPTQAMPLSPEKLVVSPLCLAQLAGG